jgi:hypothetical protein
MDDITKYRELALSATRAKIAYLPLDQVKDLWMNYKDNSNHILYYIFRDVEECPKYYLDSQNTAHAYSWKENNILFIVFRGTNKKPDMVTDISIIREKMFDDNKDILVHTGFFTYFKSLEDDITTEININLKMNKIDTICFNGHSLGAAMSTLASSWYSKIYEGKIKIINQTIGSPRIGNKCFVKWYDSIINDNIRVANTKDPVSLFPISIFYKHVSNCIYINENNRSIKRIKDMNWFLRLLYLPFGIYYRDPISRHKCDLYIDRLLKLGEWDVNKL